MGYIGQHLGVTVIGGAAALTPIPFSPRPRGRDCRAPRAPRSRIQHEDFSSGSATLDARGGPRAGG